MATGKPKDDEDQLDGVAEGVNNQDEDDAPSEKNEAAKGSGKSSTDKPKQDDTDEDWAAAKKGKGSQK